MRKLALHPALWIASVLATVWCCTLPDAVLGHGQPVALAFWGGYSPGVARCQRAIARASARCMGDVIAARQACLIPSLSGAACNTPQLNATIATLRQRALDMVAPLCTSLQLQQLRYMDLSDAYRDIVAGRPPPRHRRHIYGLCSGTPWRRGGSRRRTDAQLRRRGGHRSGEASRFLGARETARLRPHRQHAACTKRKATPRRARWGTDLARRRRAAYANRLALRARRLPGGIRPRHGQLPRRRRGPRWVPRPVHVCPRRGPLPRHRLRQRYSRTERAMR